MARELYVNKKFTPSSLHLIKKVDEVITDYMGQGYTLTVRQAYYQLVARDIIENTVKSYKNLASLINDARLAGLLDWSGIEDRTRAFKRRQRWDSGSQFMDAVARSYHQDMWAGQSCRVFVIVEKEALVGVLENVCHEFDVPLLAARGYPSASVVREFVLDDVLEAQSRHGQQVVILHLGDHDPSGIDMTRDLEDRINLFAGSTDTQLIRIALNMDQVRKLKPPENPAKTTDSRFESYMKKYGTSSWELDAIKPDALNSLVRHHIEENIDMDIFDEVREEITRVKAKFAKIAVGFK